MTLTAWLVPIVLGGVIGWGTNWLAVKMLFHPRRRVFGLHGLLPKRQHELAASVGTVVGEELVRLDDLLAPLDQVDLAPHFAVLLDQAMAEKIAELRAIPLVGGFITDQRVAGIRDGILRRLVAAQPELIKRFKAVAAERLDVAALARSKLAALDLDRLEAIVDQVASREMRAIEWWGLVLGALIGAVQAAAMAAIG